ncbi:AP-3 complex subunit delta-1-like [Saccostrea echinata]|uniref:AP-3 complex subunit delta-1-like n=1 Tax=Saccostrea echinata TaxID=191078 RepID=UPI002A8408A5|nr:AP-3 complex subunit delta-1-like [Saccostrea echinata]
MAALTDEDLERMAMEEILKESKRNAERAKEFGSLGWQNPGKSTNKRFLSNMLVSTLRNPLQKSRFNNETHSSDSERSDGRKKRRHSQEDRRRNSSERYSKSYQDEREKNLSESLYRRKNMRETYDPHSRRFSGNRQSSEDSGRKYQKSNSRNHRGNGRSSFQRGGSLGEDEDIYHEDYMEYIQNYKKHMNYYEKMEECMQEKYTRSYHSEEGRGLHNVARMEEQEGPSSKSEKLEKASKITNKRSWSYSNEFSGSDFSECEKKSKTRNHSLSSTRKKKSKHKRKGFKENERKTKQKRKNSVVNSKGNSGDVNSPEGSASARDSEPISGCFEVLKGNNSELSSTKSSQEEKISEKKQSKHKKHKNKKHKKDKESNHK